MPKIRGLTYEEAAHLRERVRTRFLQQHTNGKASRFGSFKDAYEELRNDIVEKVPGKELSVSTTRLRKLFYYTDPTICPSEQMQKASFGRDFIEVLEQYVGDEKSPLPPPEIKQKIWKMTWLLLPVLLIGGLATWFFQMEKAKNWREDFDSARVADLRAQGFGWQDFDSLWWSKQLREGSLTLYTLAGDYWVKPHEPKKIRNLIYKKVEGDCFSVVVKIDDFDPQQNCQQLTLFLFDERLSRETHLRAGFGYWTNAELDGDPGVQHTTTEYQESGHVTQQGYYHVRKPANARPSVKTLWLKILYKNGEVMVFQKANHEWNMWGICAQPFDLRFKPAYVGVGAFHGWTENDGTPRNAEPIPVFVDYIQVESCD
jgi:hypothetical protein